MIIHVLPESASIDKTGLGTEFVLSNLVHFPKKRSPQNELIWYHWSMANIEIYVRIKPTRHLDDKSLKLLVFYL